MLQHLSLRGITKMAGNSEGWLGVPVHHFISSFTDGLTIASCRDMLQLEAGAAAAHDVQRMLQRGLRPFRLRHLLSSLVRDDVALATLCCAPQCCSLLHTKEALHWGDHGNHSRTAPGRSPCRSPRVSEGCARCGS